MSQLTNREQAIVKVKAALMFWQSFKRTFKTHQPVTTNIETTIECLNEVITKLENGRMNIFFIQKLGGK